MWGRSFTPGAVVHAGSSFMSGALRRTRHQGVGPPGLTRDSTGASRASLADLRCRTLMATRKLIIAALACGLVILMAFAAWVLTLNR